MGPSNKLGKIKEECHAGIGDYILLMIEAARSSRPR